MGNIISRKVKIFNTPDEPIYTVDSDRGEVIYLPTSTTLASKASGDLINLIVPSGKIVELEKIVASGDGIALYDVKINNSSTFKKRAYYTDFNAEFDLQDKKLVAGDDIKVTIINRSGSSCDFDATLIYRVYDEWY